MIEIPKFPDLQFDERTHTYTLNGIPLPSVTTVMKPLSSAYYGGINEDILNTAAKRGTAVHEAIENYLKFGIDDIPPEHEGYYRAFRRRCRNGTWATPTSRTIRENAKLSCKNFSRIAGRSPVQA